MRLRRLISLLIIFQIPFLNAATGDVEASIQGCAKIVDNLARLTCFDTLARQLPPVANQADSQLNEINTVQTTSAIIAPQVNLSSEIKNADIAHKVEAAPAKQTVEVKSTPSSGDTQSQKENDFGKPDEGRQISALTSNIVGEFRGWVKGNVINLSNGQKWRVVSASKGYAKLQDPEVVIEEGVFGTYSMRVAGFVPLAKVRRIK